MSIARDWTNISPGKIQKTISPLPENSDHTTKTKSDNTKKLQSTSTIKNTVKTENESLKKKKELTAKQKKPLKYALYENKEIFDNSHCGLGQTRLEIALKKMKHMSSKSPFKKTNEEYDTIAP